MSQRISQRTIVTVAVAAAATVSVTLLVWHLSRTKKTEKSLGKTDKEVDMSSKSSSAPSTPTKKKTTSTSSKKAADKDPTPRRTNSSSAGIRSADIASSDDATEATVLTAEDKEKMIHAKIEQLDKQGKELYKDKKFMEAAQCYSDALDFVAKNVNASSTAMTASMQRQQITLLNNRSAMYEKALVHELALADCDALLELEMTHTKARTRKLRILEALKRYPEALQEVCAAQLLFMQANKNNLRMGLPIPNPPVPQSKMEEILNAILPAETAKYVAALEERNATSRRLPGPYTILQLLRSYTEYNAWMALAAKEGSVDQLTKEIKASSTATPVDQAVLFFKRGRRYVYDCKYEEATVDFENGLALMEKNYSASEENDAYYARLLEWTGMVRHWHYDLKSATECLEKAATIEPKNALLVVKMAGIQLDAGKQDEALKLFERALEIDPESVDALLHRSNMRMLQGKPELAKTDLETCIRLRPSHTMARLRLAAILVPMEDVNGAQRQIDLAEQSEPNNSEIYSYRGELHFSKGEMDEAQREFERAMKLEPLNPTPYVNCAMAIINTPPTHANQMPDTTKLVALLEKAIAVDPQFSAAYVHLCQLKLGIAQNLVDARKVIALYDQGLEHCRTAEEMKELCGMRLLALAQIEAATTLRMETFNFQ